MSTSGTEVKKLINRRYQLFGDQRLQFLGNPRRGLQSKGLRQHNIVDALGANKNKKVTLHEEANYTVDAVIPAMSTNLKAKRILKSGLQELRISS
ncbi:MAG TPA: hypothetical protein VFF75_01645 [Methylophilaceae bacterium]|nr:hypothetical protein [Methylophilaceae bacterium]